MIIISFRHFFFSLLFLFFFITSRLSSSFHYSSFFSFLFSFSFLSFLLLHWLLSSSFASPFAISFHYFIFAAMIIAMLTFSIWFLLDYYAARRYAADDAADAMLLMLTPCAFAALFWYAADMLIYAALCYAMLRRRAWYCQ